MTYGHKTKKIIAMILAFLMVCLFHVEINTNAAKDSFLSYYVQTVYNQQNGIGSSEANCLYQSSSGYIWIGTDSGLYRSNGSDFQSINLWDTDRTDVYVINCIIQDSTGKMWIGTDNYGLFYINDGKNHHFQEEYYNGVKSINDVCETESGIIYIATSEGLYTYDNSSNESAALAKYADPKVSGLEYIDLVEVGDRVWALDESNKIHILKEDLEEGVIDAANIVTDDFTCFENIDGVVYAGTSGSKVCVFNSTVECELLTASVDTINCIKKDDMNRIWVGADNGIGYFQQDGTFIKVTETSIDSYISDIIQDYEGNYWISSRRMGVLFLSRSKFVDFNMYTDMQETMVNTVYLYNGYKYIGTEDGLLIYDANNNPITNELTEKVKGISIRSIISDSKGNLWIGTYRKYGIVRVSSNGVITNIGRSAGLPNVSVNKIIEAKDAIVAATNNGIAVLDYTGSVRVTYVEKDGIAHGNVTSLYALGDDVIFAGTDGGGIYKINIVNGNVENYTTEDGLNSNTVTCFEEGEDGVWIGTDNGLCLYKEAFRQVSNIEYSNSIYDVISKNGAVYLIGSRGILCTTEEKLLDNKGIDTRYLDANDGLIKTVNSISSSAISDSGTLYICCNTGMYAFNTDEIPYNKTSPKLSVVSIDVDGITYELDNIENGLEVGSDASRVTIDFAVFSFSNRSNIKVEYYLEGFDDQHIVVTGNDTMKAVYTNLEGGNYKFVIKAYNGDGTECVKDVSFTIIKEKSFFETRLAKIVVGMVIVLVAALATYGILRLKKKLNINNSVLEKLTKEHEQAVKTSSAKNDYFANISNEIKIPVNAMVAKAEELLRVTTEEDTGHDIIESIYETGNEIIGKVDDIILLAKIEAGKITNLDTEYAISDLAVELSENATNAIGDKPIQFFVELGDNIQDNLIGDVGKIKDILSRIIDNAIKYTKEGSVTFSVDCFEISDKPHHNMVNIVFSVSDTGVGIQESRLGDVFEVYNKSENISGMNKSGIGVGLAIAKGYSDLLGAELEVESAYGAGTTFTLSVTQKIYTGTTANVVSKIEGTLSKEETDRMWLPEVSALLVDSDEVSREVSIKTLGRFEMKVDAATSGIRAIDMVLNNKYDVVFMDLSLPVMNGLETMREIRELSGEDFSYLPIIAINKNAIDENKASLLSEGFTDSVLNPLEPRRVAAVLKDCLPADKLRERTNDILIYMEGSRYSEGLNMLKPNIDAEVALERIGGNIEVFNKLVYIFYSQNINAVDELREKAAKNTRALKSKIHTIRTNSLNIGAIGLSQLTTKMEAAINIGNRDYVKDNLNNLYESLADVLTSVEKYLKYVESVAGITDEEYIARKKNSKAAFQGEEKNAGTAGEGEKPVDLLIDLTRLENIKYLAFDDEYDEIWLELGKIKGNQYMTEDEEFINVLEAAIKEKATAKIDELVTTYMNLKR